VERRQIFYLMKKYNQYKNSGVKWLGEIPAHWDILPGLSFIYENKEKNKGMKRNTVLSLSYGNIRIKGEDELTGLVPESFETYQFVNKGDLIFRPTDLQNDMVSLRSSISEYEGIITNAYLNLRFKSKAHSKFYHYFFRSIDNNKIIYGLGSGLRQNISYLDFRRFQFPFPPISEQTAIAHFLDDKTTKIDQAIAIKQKQIELLKERRQILIHKAVTRGLNDNVKMKDSGVDWIGEIPEHWEVKRLKYVANLVSDKMVSKGNPLNYIGMENIESWTGNYLATNSETEGLANYFKEGDILFGKLRPYLAKVYLAKDEGICTTEFLVYRNGNEIFNWYLHLLMLSFEFINLIDSSTYGSKMPRANSDFIGNQLIPIPPKDEQTRIAEFIETATTKIATVISLKEQEIEKLKEYKMSLIDGVVTGKVKVI
jgi:type I restriction enzyme S subunit